jgi:WD40 repeat protein
MSSLLRTLIVASGIWCAGSVGYASDPAIDPALVRVVAGSSDGTGIIIGRDDDSAFILTAAHVLADASSPKVHFAGNESGSGAPATVRILGQIDEGDLDLAVLEVTGLNNIPTNIKTLRLRDDPAPGQVQFEVRGYPNVLKWFERAASAPASLGTEPGRLTKVSCDDAMADCLQGGYSGGPLVSDGRAFGLFLGLDKSGQGRFVTSSEIVGYLHENNGDQFVGKHPRALTTEEELREGLKLAVKLLEDARVLRTSGDNHLALLLMAQARAFAERARAGDDLLRGTFDKAIAEATAQPYVDVKVAQLGLQVLGMQTLRDGVVVLLSDGTLLFERQDGVGIKRIGPLKGDSIGLNFEAGAVFGSPESNEFAVIASSGGEAAACSINGEVVTCHSVGQIPSGQDHRSVLAAYVMGSSVRLLVKGHSEFWLRQLPSDPAAPEPRFDIEAPWHGDAACQIFAPVVAAAFVDDGDRIVAIDGQGAINLFDAATGSNEAAHLSIYTRCDQPGFRSNTVLTAAFAPEGHAIALATRDSGVSFVDFPNGFQSDAHLTQLIAPCGMLDAAGELQMCDSRGVAWGLALSQNGGLLVAGSGDQPAQIKLVRTRSKGAPIVESTTAHSSQATNASFIGTSDAFLTAAWGQGVVETLASLRLWSPRRTATTIATEPDLTARTVAFSADGARLLVVADGAPALVHDLQSDTNVTIGRLSIDPKSSIGTALSVGGLERFTVSTALLGDGTWLLGGSEAGHVGLFHLRPGQLDAEQRLEVAAAATVTVGSWPFVKGIKAVGDSSTAVLCDEMGGVSIIRADLVTGSLETPLRLDTLEPAPCRALDALPSGSVVVAGGLTTARVYFRKDMNAETGPMETVALGTNNVDAVAVGADIVAVASAQTIGIYDPYAPGLQLGEYDRLRPIATLTFSSTITALAISNPAKLLATAGRGQVVTIFDLADIGRPTPIANFQLASPEGIGAIAFSPDGKTLAAAEMYSGIVHLLPIPNQGDALCALLQDNLSAQEWQSYVDPNLDYERTCPNLDAGVGAPTDSALATPAN